jgi:hypothetical protein
MTYRFLLGGGDLEMVEIRRLLERHAPGRFHDKGLAWGAALSAYRDELLDALRRGEVPVAIELEDDLPADLFDRRRLVVVDHHGALAGHDRPTSIEQVFALLRLSPEAWTRRLALVAANDRAHVAGLRGLGATAAEIAEIRAADRAAQGVTGSDEAEAARAVATRRRDGRLTLVETGASKTSPITDRLMPEAGGPGFDRLLVISPDEVNVFADGPAIERLRTAYPRSAYPRCWSGGDLPVAGFWGMQTPADRDRLIEDLRRRLR